MRARTAIVAGIASLAVLGTGAAYAYSATAGGGGGSLPVSDVPWLPVIIEGQDSIVLSMGERVDLFGTLTNTNYSPGSIARIEISIAQIKPSVPSSTCSRLNNVDFRIVNAVPATPFEVPAATDEDSGEANWSGGSIEFFNNPSRNQIGCLSRTLTLRYAGVAG